MVVKIKKKKKAFDCAAFFFLFLFFTKKWFILEILLSLQPVSVGKSWGSDLCSLSTGGGCHGDLKKGWREANSSFRQRFIILNTHILRQVFFFFRLVRDCLFVHFLVLKVSYKDRVKKRRRNAADISLVWEKRANPAQALMRGIIQGDGVFFFYRKCMMQSNDDLMSASLLHKSVRKPKTETHSALSEAGSAYWHFATPRETPTKLRRIWNTGEVYWKPRDPTVRLLMPAVWKLAQYCQGLDELSWG